MLTQGSGRTPQITAGVQVSQIFISHKNNLHEVGIFILMPSISTDSNVNVRVIETKSNEEIFNQDVFLGPVNDTEYLEIFFENQTNSKNKEYKIIVTGIDGNELNSVQFPYSSYPNDLLGECYESDNLQENNLVIKMEYILQKSMDLDYQLRMNGILLQLQKIKILLFMQVQMSLMDLHGTSIIRRQKLMRLEKRILLLLMMMEFMI